MVADKKKDFKNNEHWYNFFTNLNRLRQEEGLSIVKFAEKYAEISGIPKNTIKSWIERTPPKEPNLSSAVKLANALKITVDELCGSPKNLSGNVDNETYGDKEKSEDDLIRLLESVIAGNPNYKTNFNDRGSTLFLPEENGFECDTIYLPLSRAKDDRPLYRGDLKVSINEQGICEMKLTVDTVVGKRAVYKGVVILLNSNVSDKPTYWCLLKLDEQSEHGVMEDNVPAEFITYSFLAPERRSWKTIIAQVGNIISNSKNPAMFRALFIKRNGNSDEGGIVSDENLKTYFKGLLEIYDLQQIPIDTRCYNELIAYLNSENIPEKTKKQLEEFFAGICVDDLRQTLARYFTAPKDEEASSIHYLNHLTPSGSSMREGDLFRRALLTAWLRSRGKNAYINEVDDREVGFVEKIYEWLDKQNA